MAATFRPVNPNLIAQTIEEDPTAPSSSSAPTPRPNTPPHAQLLAAMAPHDAAATPTRASFATAPGQMPLPSSPFPHAVQVPHTADRLPSDHSQHSAKSSTTRDSMDVDMDDSDAEGGNGDDGSDDDSVNADGSRSSKKKKSQRFYCTDYPPCNLSFTRSEHLARHIRKHTGERPFQCHCSRRFSRLDNLRQHAQTVHVNEDIPIDSLAATGSRFQRQIRTDRVRQAGNRARASTGGSAGGPARGHSKSLSTSSIASISSVASSSYGSQAPDARRRPPPLVMAADPRSRLSLESYRSNIDSPYPYRHSSPGDYSTPTSATFSTAQSSPRWASGMASPTSSHSRSQSLYSAGSRTPGRRLSVPSGVNPFQPAHLSASGRSPFGPGLLNSSHPAALPPPGSGGVVTSPASAAAWSGRRDSNASAADEAWRRRTWHSDSRTFNGQAQHQLSAVGSQSARPNPPPPIANPSSAQSSFRLPGIESFDPVPRRNPSPMAIDSDAPTRRPVYQPAEPMQPDERRNLNMYDASLQRGLTRLDISRKTPPRDSAGAWASEVNKAVQAQAERVRRSPSVRFEDQLPPSHAGPPAGASARSLHQQTMSAPSMTAPKRHGWYHGPPVPRGVNGPPPPPPQDPRVAHVDRMVHPNLTGFNGFPGREPPAPQQQDRPANAESLRRLEALVAVATSEGSTATAY
ncbi:hypothetical protein HRG_008406 [Hirsutella rhossiliensis]|uniref:C2H2-type domain-containing protein n=1 Tax=Hirsutella rhossiliensis TaxID=111463 RepID=A0A9P8MU43_9HYPO|nr:uncharacterized protein HRG_08406 [Hirsutella rhossiliensis]KAH0960251.1 hypothetical protein HRG_08406 [Hirsutella rhossiliensis]